MKTQQNEDDFVLGIWKMEIQGVVRAKETNNNNQVQCINTYSEWKERNKQIKRNVIWIKNLTECLRVPYITQNQFNNFYSNNQMTLAKQPNPRAIQPTKESNCRRRSTKESASNTQQQKKKHHILFFSHYFFNGIYCCVKIK